MNLELKPGDSVYYWERKGPRSSHYRVGKHRGKVLKLSGQQVTIQLEDGRTKRPQRENVQKIEEEA